MMIFNRCCAFLEGGEEMGKWFIVNPFLSLSLAGKVEMTGPRERRIRPPFFKQQSRTGCHVFGFAFLAPAKGL